MFYNQFIRNFSIIAHISHGKSTLTGKLIQFCNRNLNKEFITYFNKKIKKKITIKSQIVRLNYISKIKKIYILNVIDTPGHIDFNYEINKSITICEGSILIIDITQNVKVQTIANAYKAINNNHEIIIILNKIDLQNTNLKYIRKNVKRIICPNFKYILKVSAKIGIGIKNILESVIQHILFPLKKINKKFEAILIDNWYDKYLGIIILIKVISGIIKKGECIKIFPKSAKYIIESLGVFMLNTAFSCRLLSGDIGFLIFNIKELSTFKVGSNIIHVNLNFPNEKYNFDRNVSTIFCNIYPKSNTHYLKLHNIIKKLKFIDISFQYIKISSKIFGHGFKCGFFGILHLKIVQEKLRKEYGFNLIITDPNIFFKIYFKNDINRIIYDISYFSFLYIKFIEEPWVRIVIIHPYKYFNTIINLCKTKQGIQEETQYHVMNSILIYKIPLSEILFGFYEKLKHETNGYAVCNWNICEYRENNLVKMNILINCTNTDILSFLLNKNKIIKNVKLICITLKKIISNEYFSIPIQIHINNKVVFKINILPIKKNVISKCYGGDITRKKKLLEKQKVGKKHMLSFNRMHISKKNIFSWLKKIKSILY